MTKQSNFKGCAFELGIRDTSPTYTHEATRPYTQQDYFVEYSRKKNPIPTLGFKPTILTGHYFPYLIFILLPTLAASYLWDLADGTIA